MARSAVPVVCLLALLAVLGGRRVANAAGTPIYNPATGHYYLSVPAPPGGINWNDAKAAAAASTYQGLPGYLATITNGEEWVWTTSHLGDAFAKGYLIGGYQTPGSQEPAEGWHWVSGEPWTYVVWDPGEPNNAGGKEDVLQLNGGSRWNDVSALGSYDGYVIEYGTNAPLVTPIEFSLPARYEALAPENVSSADFDQDGHIDLAVSTGGDNAIMYGAGDGTFSDPVYLGLTTKSGILETVAADVDGDGNADLLLVADDSVYVFRRTAPRSYAIPARYLGLQYSYGLVAQDFNGDGRPDIAACDHRGGNVAVYMNQGNGAFGPPVYCHSFGLCTMVLTGDWDRDGNQDVGISNITSTINDDSVSILYGDGKGGFPREQRWRLGGNQLFKAVSADWNGDGIPDLIGANMFSNNIGFALGNGDGTFQPPGTAYANNYPNHPSAADFDLDGDPDVITSNGGMDYISMLRNNDGSASYPIPWLASGKNAGYLTTGDFNEDGRPDVAVTCVLSNVVSVFLNITRKPPPAPPNAPANLKATGVSSTQINLSWTDASKNETEFRIERKNASGVFAQLAKTGPNVTTYSDSGLKSNTTYTYRVLAANSVGISVPSNEASATTAKQIPLAPTGLSVVVLTRSSLKLVWTDASNNEKQFSVERKSGGGSFTPIATPAANSTSHTDSGLTTGVTYTYRVRASNDDGDSPYSNEASGTPAKQIPPPPSSLAVSVISKSSLKVTWRDNSGNESGFKLERKAPGGSFAQIAIPGMDATSFTDNGLSSDTPYTYRVRATNEDGDSAYSNEGTGTTLPELPPAPGGLVALAIDSGVVDLSWDYTGPRTNNFLLERKAGGGSYFSIGQPAFESRSFQDDPVDAETTYTYRLRSSNAAGVSAPSLETRVTTLAAPTDLAITGLAPGQVKLTWTDHSKLETGYLVDRKTGNGAYSQVGKTAANAPVYTDSTLVANTSYTYRVRAYSPTAFSSFTGEAGYATLGAPVNLQASAQSTTAIKLTWVDGATGESGFSIERKSGSAAYQPVGATPANAAGFTDAGLQPGTFYSYRVRATSSTAVSAYSNEASVSTPPTPPKAPSALAVAALSTSDLKLSWTDASTDESGFKIERRTGSNAYQELIVVSANKTSYTDSGLQSGVTYTYRVRAYNSGGDSAYSNEASNAPFPPSPSAPADLTATVKSQTRVDLAWTDRSSSESGFKIERSVSGGGYTLLFTTAANAQSYSDTSCQAKTVYFYRVKATNRGGDSAASNVAQVKTPPDLPGAPTALKATAISETRIDLSWTQGGGGEESGFKIERKSGGSGYGETAGAGANVTTYSDSGLQPNTAYTYRVRALNDAGASAYSNEASITTGTALGGILEVAKKLAFGKVKIKTTAVKSLVIRNRSTTERLQVTLTPPAAPYALTGTAPPSFLAPGGQVTVQISFKPLKKKKAYTGALKIASSDPGHRTATVKLTGAGK